MYPEVFGYIRIYSGIFGHTRAYSYIPTNYIQMFAHVPIGIVRSIHIFAYVLIYTSVASFGYLCCAGQACGVPLLCSAAGLSSKLHVWNQME